MRRAPPCCPPRWPRFLLLLLLGGALGGVPEGLRPAHADDKPNWREEPRYKQLLAAEARALVPLMREALKEDFRRQAWYLADRVLAARPADPEAEKVLETWSDAHLLEGKAPTPAFETRRDRTFEEVGTELAKFAETLNGAGVDAEDYHELTVRALAYGSRYSALVAALQEAGYAFLGGLRDHEVKAIEAVTGERWKSMTFPPPWDDAALKVRVRWPAAACAVLGPWRLYTDLKAMEALHVLCVLEAAREHVEKTLGGGPPALTTPIEVVLFAEGETYVKTAEHLVPAAEKDDVLSRSAWYSRMLGQGERVVACWRHRVNGWIGEDATVLGAAAHAIARRHFAQNAGGGVSGRGAWLLEGLGGALEGFVWDPKTGKGDVEPARCWRLAAAKALRGEGRLLAWDALVDLDRTKAEALPRTEVKLAFRGGTFEAKDLRLADVQATAFAVGLWKADKGKGAKRLGDLLQDLFKRDSLPDLDKALGWKKGRWQQEADKAIDAATGL